MPNPAAVIKDFFIRTRSFQKLFHNQPSWLTSASFKVTNFGPFMLCSLYRSIYFFILFSICFRRFHKREIIMDIFNIILYQIEIMAFSFKMYGNPIFFCFYNITHFNIIILTDIFNNRSATGPQINVFPCSIPAMDMFLVIEGLFKSSSITLINSFWQASVEASPKSVVLINLVAPG